MSKTSKKQRVVLSIIIILIVISVGLLLGKFTYSYMGADIGEDINTEGEVTASGDTLIFSKGNNLSLHATTDNFNLWSDNLTDTTNPSVKLVSSGKTNNATATYYVGFNIKENTYKYTTTQKTAELILTVKDENGDLVTTAEGLNYVTVNGVSGFDITELTGLYDVVIDHPISTNSSTNGTTHTWTFTLNFINLETAQDLNENASFNMDVILQQEQYVPTFEDICANGDNFATCIKNYYTVDGENGLYLHDADLANGANDGSYRYAGASESVNNFVCFASDADTCPDDNLYRIIGVFGDNVKLIKHDYATSAQLGTDGEYSTSPWSASDYSTYKGSLTKINTYHWDNTNFANVWANTALNTINLNTNYIAYLNGINTKWANMIAETTWKVGGNIWASIANPSMNVAYQNEIVNPAESTTYKDEIGLMYVSDYGYAASPTYWTYKGYATATTDYQAATGSNWMYMGIREWTISRRSDRSDNVFTVDFAGHIGGSYVGNLGDNVARSNSVRPSFSLKSTVTYDGGSGSAGDPFRIS